MLIKPGMRVRVSEGSGIDSGKSGIVLQWDDKRAQEVRKDYPFVGGRTTRGWSAILVDKTEKVTALPNTRLQNLRERCAICLCFREHHKPDTLACPTARNQWSKRHKFQRMNTHCIAEYKLCASFGIQEDGAELPSSAQAANLRQVIEGLLKPLCAAEKGVDQLRSIEITHEDTYYE